MKNYKTNNYSFISTAENLQLCYTNHPVVVICITVDRC